jgi:hypothetical protein
MHRPGFHRRQFALKRLPWRDPQTSAGSRPGEPSSYRETHRRVQRSRPACRSRATPCSQIKTSPVRRRKGRAQAVVSFDLFFDEFEAFGVPLDPFRDRCRSDGHRPQRPHGLPLRRNTGKVRGQAKFEPRGTWRPLRPGPARATIIVPNQSDKPRSWSNSAPGMVRLAAGTK